MRYPIKNLLAFVTIIASFIFCNTKVAAQYPGMAAVYKQIAANQQNQWMMMMGNALLRGNQVFPDTYKVKLKDSTVKEITSFIYTDSIKHKDYIIFEDTKFKRSDAAHRYQKIYPDQTLTIAVQSRSYDYTIDDYTYNTFGKPTDSCWMFDTIIGAIKVYGKYSKLGKNDYKPENIVGISLNGGKMEKFTDGNIKKMVATNAKALELANDGKYYRAIMRFNKGVEKATYKKSNKAAE